MSGGTSDWVDALTAHAALDLERWAAHTAQHATMRDNVMAVDLSAATRQDELRAAVDQRLTEALAALDARYAGLLAVLREERDRRFAAIDHRLQERAEHGQRDHELMLEAVSAVEIRMRREKETFHAQSEKAVEVRATTLDKEFREHLDQVRHETSLAFDASEKSIAKSEAANEKRFAAVNEFRAQLADQTATFIPRIEAEQRIAQNSEKITELTDRMNRGDGRSSGMSTTLAWLIGIVPVVVGVLTVIVILVTRHA